MCIFVCVCVCICVSVCVRERVYALLRTFRVFCLFAYSHFKKKMYKLILMPTLLFAYALCQKMHMWGGMHT